MTSSSMAKLTSLAAALSIVVLALQGCGYSFAASGSGLPKDATTIYVAKFKNDTRFTGLDEEFMRHMKDEIAIHKRLELVNDAQGADLTLSGDITGVIPVPSGYNSAAEPTTYLYNMSVSAELVDDRTGAVIWSSPGIFRQEQFGNVFQGVVTTSPEFQQENLRANNLANMPDIQVARTQQAYAKGETMDAIAHDIYSYMSEGF